MDVSSFRQRHSLLEEFFITKTLSLKLSLSFDFSSKATEGRNTLF